MIRVLHLDEDIPFIDALKVYFRRLVDIDYEGTREHAKLRKAFDEDMPNVVLLGMGLQPQRGLAVLQEIRKRFTSDKVKVILLSMEAPSEHELMKTARLGADYFVQRPVDLFVLETRIRQLTTKPADPPREEVTRRQVHEICTGYFEQMGVPPHYKGYRYLMEGIWLACVHSSWLNSVTQILYPAIGQRFEVNGSQVERAMRYALDVTWEKGNVEQLYNLFPYVRESKGKPTNSAFIARMVELVKLAVRNG